MFSGILRDPFMFTLFSFYRSLLACDALRGLLLLLHRERHKDQPPRNWGDPSRGCSFRGEPLVAASSCRLALRRAVVGYLRVSVFRLDWAR